ncbi:MAG: hypothetical protein Q4D65_08080 [Peptostreptococcaceae bacterium]|nr:hypothetical protein [Peptostreptococcaceae bacterium]
MNEADILATTYNHTCTVIRPAPVANSHFDDFEMREIYQDVACAVSFTKGSFQGQSDTTQSIQYAAILFVRPEIQILAGDRITARTEGIEIDFLAGEGMHYPSHNEIPLIRKDDA